MYRLFVGLSLPRTVRSRLAGLGGGLPGARWVAPENLHLTLRFVGEVGRDDALDIHQALGRVRAEPFDLTISGLGAFETGSKVRVLWAGVAREPRLLALQDRVDSALTRAGVAIDRRKFKPHITLARFRNGGSQRVGGFIEANNPLAMGPVPVPGFTLFRSFLGHEGAHYEALADYDLTGGAAALADDDAPAGDSLAGGDDGWPEAWRAG